MKLGFLVDGTMREIATLATPADPEEAVELIATAINGASPADAFEAVGIGGPGTARPADRRGALAAEPAAVVGVPPPRGDRTTVRVPARSTTTATWGARRGLGGSGCGYATVLYLAIGTVRPRLYAALSAIGARLLRFVGGRRGLIHRLPLASGWTNGRDFPAPSGHTFRELYRSRQKP